MLKVKLRKLLSMVLMLALAICQVPGRVVLVGTCEMECCKSEAKESNQLAIEDNCCCTTVEVKHHAEHPASPSPTIQIELEAALPPHTIVVAEAETLEPIKIPSATANGPPKDPPCSLPPSRAPPIS